MENITSSTQSQKDIRFEPIKIEKESCPLCKKIAIIFALVLMSLAICLASGVALALAGVSPLKTFIIFGVVGLAMGIALAILVQAPSPNLKYRVATLDQIQDILDDDKKLSQLRKQKLIQCVQKVKEIFSEESVQFKQAYDHHAMHNDLTIITDWMLERKELKKIWKLFLENVQDASIYYPGGEQLSLNTNIEMDRLKNRLVDYSVEQLDPKSASFRADLQQIVDLELECFGDIGKAPISRLESVLNQENAGCLVVRRQNSEEILGFLWYYQSVETPDTLYIPGIGRKAGAARMRIGEKLFDKFLTEDKRNFDIQLHVRASNTSAIALYEKYGFVKGPIVENYYPSAPRENAYLMGRNSQNVLDIAV